MRIGFVISRLSAGGAERQLLTLAKGLKARGHFVVIYSFYSDNFYGRLAEDSGIEIRCLHKKGRRDVVGLLRRLQVAIRVDHLDVLHSYLSVADVFASIAKIRVHVPVVWGIRQSAMNAGGSSKLGAILLIARKLLTRNVDLFICNSRSAMELVATSGVPAEKIRIIPNGIDTLAFRPDRAAGRAFRQQIGALDQEILVGIVGRIHPSKGLETFLASAKRLSAMYSNARFAIVGEGHPDYVMQIRALAASLGLTSSMYWCAPTTQITSVYQGLDILISTSLTESFSNVVSEACACGVPCIATDVGDSLQILRSVGDVVAIGDIDSIVSCASRIIDRIEAGLITDEERMSLHRSIRQRYSIEKLVMETESQLQALVSGQGAT